MSSVINKLSEVKLKILEEWKQKYEEALIDSLNPTGNVLEIGFGSGFAAESIQKKHPKTHTIIEADPLKHEAALKWAAKKPNITIIRDKWEKALPKLGTFDTIFFNERSIGSDIGIMNFLFPEDMIGASKQAKQLLGDLEEQMSKMNIKFSDQDIMEFYQNIGQFNRKEMPQFFEKLKQNGNISNAQYESTIKNYPLNEKVSNHSLNAADIPDNMLLFLEECLKNRTNKGCRFSAFLNSQVSKYEDALFFDRIITNSDVDYTETMISVKTTDKPREALFVLAIRR